MEQANVDLPNIEIYTTYTKNTFNEEIYNPFEMWKDIPKLKEKEIEYKVNTNSKLYADHKTNVELFKLRSSYSYNYFTKNLELKSYQALALICVLYSESRLNSNIGKSWGGHGIAQWTQSRKNDFHVFSQKELKLEKKSSIKQYEYTAHIKYVEWEFENKYPKILELLKNSKSFKQAVDIVLRGYENGSGSSLVSKAKITDIYNNPKQGNLTYTAMYNDRVNNKQHFNFLMT